MNDAGLSEYCVDICTFDLDLATSTFNRLVQNQDDIKRRLNKIVAAYKTRLLQQFDDLFGVTESPIRAEADSRPQPDRWPACIWQSRPGWNANSISVP
jgi:hypothetical protein